MELTISDCSSGDGKLIQVPHTLNWRIRYTLFVTLIFTPEIFSTDFLLVDDFSGNLYDNWFLFGDPLPVSCDTMGLPAPSFNNNGDSMFSSGAISRETYDYSEGLSLECDMYVTSNERGAWISGILSLGFIEEGEYGPDGIDLPQEITFAYIYSGEADWGSPHLQGILYTTVLSPYEERDHIRRCHTNEYLDSWHKFKIVLEPDMTVSFYIDSILLHESVLEFPPDLGRLSVLIGSQSSSWGRVYHDNLILTRP